MGEAEFCMSAGHEENQEWGQEGICPLWHPECDKGDLGGSGSQWDSAYPASVGRCEEIHGGVQGQPKWKEGAMLSPSLLVPMPPSLDHQASFLSKRSMHLYLLRSLPSLPHAFWH